MTTSQTLPTPTTYWAQRKNCVFLTIGLEDCKDPTVEITPAEVHFRGVGGTDKKEYELRIDLNEDVDPENSAHVVRERGIELCLKKVKENFWPRLTKSSSKKHWLKIDFNKWKDEDDDEEEDEMGGMAGMPGMGGMGGMPGMGGLGGGDMDFEKMMKEMGGLGAMGGPGGSKPDLGDLDGPDEELDSDDDEELPELE